jgi:hypothetical protein
MRFNEPSISYYLRKGAINMSEGPKGYIDFRNGRMLSSELNSILRK